MRSIKYIIVLVVLVLSVGRIKAQQDPQYSQYMFNQLVINPAYAGSRDAISATFLLREQWVGIDAAPATQSLSIHGPLRGERSSLGFGLYHDKLGITSQTSFLGSYAFRFPVGPGRLAFGLQGGGLLYQNDWSSIQTVDVDQQIPQANQSLFLPQVGTGLFYDTKRFYLGVSVPNFIKNTYKKEKSGLENDATQVIHMFSTIGVVVKLSEDVDFKPSIMAKYAENSPLEFDFNASFLFKETFWVGASYRTGDAIVMILEYVYKNRVRFGYAYDYTITELNNFNSGSHELMLGFDFGFKKSKIITPRYF